MAAKYREIAYKLELELRQMRSDGRTRLPAEAELCSMFSCSRQTVRAALDDLAQRGLIVKRKGSGSYLAGSITDRSSTVVLIIEDEDEYTNPSFISRLRQMLKDRKYELICRSTGGLISGEAEILSELQQEPPAAVIIEPVNNVIPNPNISLICGLHSKGIPVIYLRTSYPEPREAPMIGEDNKEGPAILVRHLKERGHTNIAGIFRCDDSRGLMRYQGFYEALGDANLPFDEQGVLMISSSDRKRIMRGDNSLLTRFINDNLRGKTAVICQNDEIAFRLIQVLNNNGKRVPGDVAVVSFDDSYYASSAGITSLGHSSRNMSSIVSDQVTAAIEHKRIPAVCIEWRLNVRNSG